MKINGKRVVIRYQEKYKPGMGKLKDSAKPELHHIAPGYRVAYAELLTAGSFEDGREFQDIRVILEEG